MPVQGKIHVVEESGAHHVDLATAALLGRRAVGEVGREAADQVGRLGLARDHGHEFLVIGLLAVGVEDRVVFDGVGDPAEQIGVGDRGPKLARQLGDRQREGA